MTTTLPVVGAPAPGAHTDEGQDQPATAVDAAAATVVAARQADLPMELVWVDPRTLILGPNVRTDVRLDKLFVGHIADHGVLEPIKARRTDDGGLSVLFGARRTRGAVEAGRDVVPVIAVTAPDDEKAGEILRIIEQLGENQHRTGLTDAEEVRAHQGLLDLGLTATQIARRTRVSPKRVKQTAQVARSATASGAMDRFELNLEQAAAIAEFDDAPEAVKALTVAAKKTPEQFPHVLQRLRDAREEAAEFATAAQQLTKAGVRVIDRPDSLVTGEIRKLTDLRATPATVRGTELAVKEHTTCPGHAAFLHDRRHLDPDNPIVAAYVCTDWQAHGHAELNASDPAELAAAAQQLTEAGVPVVDEPDSLFGGKLRRLIELRPTPDTASATELTVEEHAACPGHAAFLEDRSRWNSANSIVAVYVCTDWHAHGHAERYPASTGKAAGPMTERQKTERREVIANNKVWDSATKVRQDWLRQFLARRSAPKDAQRWIAATLAHGSHDIRRAMESSHPLARDLLGLKQDENWYRGSGMPHPIAAAAAKASPTRATMLTLGVLLAGLESGTDRNTWRSPTDDSRAYFTALRDWGYPLSDVEQLVVKPTGVSETASVNDTGN